MVVAEEDLSAPIRSEEIRHWAKATDGIGFDQLLITKQDPSNHQHFYVQIFNADGSAAEQCGNGMRALALFVEKQYACDPNDGLCLITPAGPVSVHESHSTAQLNTRWVRITLPGPTTAKPMTPPPTCPAINGMQVLIGNPHWVLFWPNKPTADECDEWGQVAQAHPAWPTGVNVGLAYMDQAQMSLRVYERGVGATLACGSGACAAVIAHQTLNKVTGPVQVEQPGGMHVVNWLGQLAGDNSVELSGDVSLLAQNTILRTSDS